MRNYYLEEVNVSKGSSVSTGDLIGQLGQTQEQVPFHFEIWHNQNQVNPEDWLQKN